MTDAKAEAIEKALVEVIIALTKAKPYINMPDANRLLTALEHADD